MLPGDADRIAMDAADKMIAEIRRVHEHSGHQVAYHVIRGFLGGCGGYLRHVWGPEVAFTTVQDVADQAARNVALKPFSLPPKE